ncbi:MAG: 16S rRNA (guanine(966)-N(2))-methyltransferase RsmD [Lentisphaerae bacterium]|nr:16S rRNA (guanine(966)-N(2))-methyltransferase RsmD [Lentisphaerota bacterium]
MRITGGQWRGRLLKVPRGKVRPAQDRVRQAVFSALAERVAGARVLDLFAGTGVYGLEALSRGAASATWVENDRRVLTVLRENVAALCGPDFSDSPRAAVVAANVLRFLAQGQAPPERYAQASGGGAPYDLIIADPPYDRNGQWLKKILSVLAGHSILQSDGLLIIELAAQAPVLIQAPWQLVKRRVYGETQIDYLAIV